MVSAFWNRSSREKMPRQKFQHIKDRRTDWRGGRGEGQVYLTYACKTNMACEICISGAVLKPPVDIKNLLRPNFYLNKQWRSAAVIPLAVHATTVLHCIINTGQSSKSLTIVFLTHETFGVKSRTSFRFFFNLIFRWGGKERGKGWWRVPTLMQCFHWFCRQNWKCGWGSLSPCWNQIKTGNFLLPYLLSLPLCSLASEHVPEDQGVSLKAHS